MSNVKLPITEDVVAVLCSADGKTTRIERRAARLGWLLLAGLGLGLTIGALGRLRGG